MEMNAVNATSLYLSACRSVFQCDVREPDTYAELYRVLPYLKDSLSCLVCGNLLQDPIAPTDSTCQHYVCKACKGKKMSIKPTCSWCKDYKQFAENRQLGILVECYRKLCEYISESPLVEKIASTSGGSPEIMFMLEDVLGMKLEKESPSALDMTSLALPMSPAVPERLPLISSPARPPQPSLLEGQGPVKEECLADTDDAKATAVVEASSSELRSNMGSVLGLEPAISRQPSLVNAFKQPKYRCEPILFSVEEVLDSLKVDCDDVRDSLQKEMSLSLTLAPQSTQHRVCLKLEPWPLHTVPDHTRTPTLGISCSVATTRAVGLSRKRSHSESDREKVKPMPIASLIEDPTVATQAPITLLHEPKDTTVLTLTKAPASDCDLQLNKAVLSKNVQCTPQQIVKKACLKTNKHRPRAKSKDMPGLDGVLSSGGSQSKVYRKAKEKKGCKCGRATQNPSVLTCRGQRCPCYSTRKACLDCICRGCQNSYMANGEKKLEAFAVPEKALEQTRLTLGINYTSIAVQNIGASTDVLSLSTDSPSGPFHVDTSQDGPKP